MVDCDVIQADGGTRTASITGGYVALHLAMQKLIDDGELEENPLVEPLAAVSVGLLAGQALLDLPYEEDSKVDVDLNVVMTDSGGIVEVQGTAEGEPIHRKQFDAMLDAATIAIAELGQVQRKALDEADVDLETLKGSS